MSNGELLEDSYAQEMGPDDRTNSELLEDAAAIQCIAVSAEIDERAVVEYLRGIQVPQANQIVIETALERLGFIGYRAPSDGSRS